MLAMCVPMIGTGATQQFEWVDEVAVPPPLSFNRIWRDPIFFQPLGSTSRDRGLPCA
jgi:hypothetical protein